MFLSSIWTFVAASASSTAVPYLDKTEFLRLQNGRSVPLDNKQANEFTLLRILLLQWHIFFIPRNLYLILLWLTIFISIKFSHAMLFSMTYFGQRMVCLCYICEDRDKLIEIEEMKKGTKKV